MAQVRIAWRQALVIIPDEPQPLERKAVELLRARLIAGGAARVTIVSASQDGAGVDLSGALVVYAGAAAHATFWGGRLARLDLTPVLRPEGYLLYAAPAAALPAGLLPEGAAGLALVCGADAHGVLYGLGRLLRCMAWEPTPALPPLHERTAPATAERGVYFATHFNNYYECAPLEELERYIEELALWGVNAFLTYFDTNWYPAGFWEDPDSLGMTLAMRLRRLHQIARGVGMRAGITGCANEGFAYQPPEELRADPAAHHGAWYPFSAICPSQPAGRHMILENRRRVLELVGPIDFFILAPYDPGSCGCAQCHYPGHPWGRTFLELGAEIAALLQEYDPGARMVVADWFLDDEERALLYDACRQEGRWLDGLIMDLRQAGGAPAGLGCAFSVLSEVSMFDCYYTSYGANGANPAPRRFVEQARRVASVGYGAFIYSEGIYEDLNKVVWACALWDPQRTPEEIVGEYAHYYFGAAEQPATALILGLEETWGAKKLRQTNPATTERLLALAESVQAHAPATPLARLLGGTLEARARMDALMLRSEPDQELQTALAHAFEQAGYARDLTALRGAVRDLVERLRGREETIQQLFETYYAYLESCHTERTTVLLYRPDELLGGRHYGGLMAALTRALTAADDAALRREVLRAVKRWFWFNGVETSFFYL